MELERGTFLYEAWTARWSLLEGLMVTISSSIMTIVIGTVLGFVVGLILTYGMLPLRLARLYVDVMRGIPVLVLILFTYYGLAILKVGVKPFWAGVIALSLFCISHVAENVRGRCSRSRRASTRPAWRSACASSSGCATSSCRRRCAGPCRPGSTRRSRSSRARRCSR
ncbi:MAG: ABC transporter permease subunit [Geminicoccaceae bacterium]